MLASGVRLDPPLNGSRMLHDYASFGVDAPNAAHEVPRHVHESNVEPASPPDPGVHDGQRDRYAETAREHLV